jgi:hypothetical protein
MGCVTGIPVREALKEDLSIPVGKIEGNQFTGIRYLFKVSAPPRWKIAMEFPDFMEELGFDKPSPNDKEVTEVYIYNPQTRSNIQFDFTPAGRYSTFSQESIEWITSTATESLKSELEKEHGKGAINVEVGPTERIQLKGVQFAAKKYVSYSVKGEKREHGWIYGFSEPYQIFIIYMIVEKGGGTDRQDLKAIIDSFEAVRK